MISVFWRVILPPVYSLPCLVLHAVIVKVLLKFRKTVFQSSFYYIIIAMSFTDCVVFITTTLVLRLPLVPFFVEYARIVCDNCPVLTTFLLYIQFHGLHFQQFVGVLIAINRFSLVAFPLQTEIFWQHHTIHALVFTALLPACMTFHIAIEGTVLDCTVEEGICTVNNLYVHFPNLHKSTFMTVSATVCTLVSLVLNFATAATLYRTQKHSKNIKTTEKRLFFISLILFAHNVIILLIHLLSHLTRVNGFASIGPYVLPIRTAIIDSAVVVTPLTVYFLSPSIKAAVKEEIKSMCGCKTSVATAAGQSNTIQLSVKSVDRIETIRGLSRHTETKRYF